MTRPGPHSPWHDLIREAEMASRGVLCGTVAPLGVAVRTARRTALPGETEAHGAPFVRLHRACVAFLDAKPGARASLCEGLRACAFEADQALALITPLNRLPYRDD